MKLKNKHKSLHLEIQRHRSSCYGVIRSSYRESGKVNHTNHGRITGLDYEQLKLIQAAFRGDVVMKNCEDGFKLLDSKEYGASAAFMKLAKELELDKMIYSRSSEQWVKDALAMIVGRIVYAGSKLFLSHEYENTVLWELCGVFDQVDVDQHCYEAMDKILNRQEEIQKKLAQRYLKEGALILYDLTSSYLEGEYKNSELVEFGYNRDSKKGHEQIVIGLLCSEEGCPVGVEVFPGNTQDAKTVSGKIKEIQEKYCIKEIVFVGDRGTITQANYHKLKDIDGLNVITALTHKQVENLLANQTIECSLFDIHNLAEVTDLNNPNERYCLCKNPFTAEKETQTRFSLLELTKKGLSKIGSTNKKYKPEIIGARVGKILNKYKTGKYIAWGINHGRLEWQLNQAKIDQDQSLDGCYIIRTNVAKNLLNTEAVVNAYKKLTLVEIAFRNLKTIELEVRPVYHKKDDRIRCHVFICMLAYFLQWHALQRLAPLFAIQQEGKQRELTFAHVISTLSAIRKQKVRLNKIEFFQITELTKNQEKLLNFLKIKL